MTPVTNAAEIAIIGGGTGGCAAVIDGLYLCGSGSHPGGNITGLPGYNAAHVILQKPAAT
ncbi:MAG: hypothetical protein ACO3DQ_03765 [Cephaloticoccus sp.]